MQLYQMLNDEVRLFHN